MPSVVPAAVAADADADADALDHLIEFGAMASACHVRLAGVAAATARSWAAQAIAEVHRIEHKYSRYRSDSIVSRINTAAGQGTPVTLDTETADLLGFADQLWRASDGLFDITSGVLRRAWDFRAGRLPEPAQVEALLPLVGWADVAWSRESIVLPRAGMELDFGGFGKEYAADRAATVLLALGATSGLVNLGGDLRVLGPRPDGSPWHIGITHPRQPGAVIASLPVHQAALATSGDYERYLEVAGRRYCHILHPRRGWPVAHWQGISVLAPACLAAGALSTIAMLHEAGAEAFLQAQGVPYLAIDAQGCLTQVGAADP